ncbi:CdaR family protein [Evansella halocellulosilytica]|uniref:CdaR family protein n=1 Tax=Evansella halocellulosilytica TaxID=2011013 RepID=UPI000BB8AEFB|nr:CdaR family protein [Evansella halocellulosilytica]
MDKWFSNPWVIKGVSLLIAIMLFLMVNMDNNNMRTQPGGIPGITDGERVLEDVPLTILYDEENYVLTDAPETVQVTLRGPQNLLVLSQLSRSTYEVFVDLREDGAGEHYERIRHSGFPQELQVSIVPMAVPVTLQEKQTVSYPVEVDLINEDELPEGYSVGSPSVEPSTIEVTAAEGLIQQIDSVRTTVDVSDRDGPFQESSSIVVLDRNGNELPVDTEPSDVEISVPISSPEKEVSVRVEEEGEANEGITIDSITPIPETVTIFGPLDVLDGISYIDGITVDLSEITGDTTLEVDVPLPDDVERVDPETITIEIETTEEETVEFSDMEIEVIGLSEDKSYSFLSPSEGLIDIVLMGSPSELDGIDRDDIDIFINAEDLSDGEHEVSLEINGPRNITVESNQSNVNFIVYDGDDENAQASDSDESDDEENDETS